MKSNDMNKNSVRALEEVAYAGAWCKLIFALTKLMPLHPAVIMSFLLFWETRYTRTNKDGKGWFYCTEEKMRDYLDISPRAQYTGIKHLVRLGFLEKKRRGIPPLRYFKIDKEKLYAEIDRIHGEYPYLCTNRSSLPNT